MIKDNNYYNLLYCNVLSEDIDNSKLQKIKNDVIKTFLDDPSVENFLNQEFRDLEDFEDQLKCVIHDFQVNCLDMILTFVSFWAMKHLNSLESIHQVRIEVLESCHDLVGAYTKRITDDIDIHHELLMVANFRMQSIEDIMADIGMSNRDFL